MAAEDTLFGEDQTSEILNYSDEAFDEILKGNASGASPSANQLKGAQQPAAPSKVIPPQRVITPIGQFDNLDLDEELKTPVRKRSTATVVNQDPDDDGAVDNDAEEEEAEIAVAKPKKKAVAPAEDEVDDSPEVDVDDAPDSTEDDEDEDEDDATAAEKTAKRGVVLKNTIDFLVNEGYWFDFKGRKELTTVDTKTYAALVQQQDQARVSSLFEEMVDQSGPVGKAIFSHVQKGGNPEEVIDIFKERKKVESIDLESEAGQREIIRMHLARVGRDEAYISKHLKRVELDSELELEAKSAQELLKKEQDRELSVINRRQEEEDKRLQREDQEYRELIEETLVSRKDLSPEEKKIIKNKITKFDVKLGNKTVNAFYVDFARMQQDPNEYIDLVQFVSDKKKYLARQLQPKRNAKVEHDFDFIKDNAAVAKKGRDPIVKRRQEKEQALDFGI